MTNRQEIRDFDFYDGPIGLEVESQYGKITVTKVVEGSQAASYGTVLVGAEIVAVNEQRVITLEEFQNAVLVARSMGFLITIKAASYKGESLEFEC
jgi:C-terminal processing protease CtpA/Prc